jgi:hypothetical protein
MVSEIGVESILLAMVTKLLCDPTNRAYFVPDFSRHQIYAETDSCSQQASRDQINW